MERGIYFIVFFSLYAAFILTMSLTDAKSALATLAEGSNKFAFELYQALRNSSENLIVSPISLQIVLALAYTGAQEDTAKEIADVLHLPDNLDTILNGHKELIEGLKNPVLKIATKMFIEQSFEVKEAFQSGAENFFQSDVKKAPFSTNAEGARKEINDWVEEKTEKKIKELLPRDSVDALTRLVLVNAIHFKANWKKQFNPALTHDVDFYVTKEKTVKVKMMSMKSKFPYKHHSGLQAKILELPYSGDDFRMVIILPDEIDGLPAVEAKLATMNIPSELQQLHVETVDVGIPKFKLEQNMELISVLTKLGMKNLFKSTANLKGISDEDLYVSKVVQKAFIEVNEEGTEAAAATGARSLVKSFTYPENPWFIANHPFALIIRKKNVVIFNGYFSKPY